MTVARLQAVAAVVFVLIEFSLVIIPFAFLVFRPEGTKAWIDSVITAAMGQLGEPDYRSSAGIAWEAAG